jgi:serine/threonine protein kinase
MTMTIDPLIGKQLGDYRIVDILGRGGMAHVYRGFDKKLQRYAAVKVIDANLLSSNESEDEYRARFQREARSIAHLNHPNIVGVYQFGEAGTLYYMAMAFIEGRDLGHILKEHAEDGTEIPTVDIIQIIRDISAALDHAHHQGVIHRDIKPSNIMVTRDGRAILTDFGLALSVPEGSIGNTFGSAHYIAPEQAISSAKAVPQSDLYSLGVVLFQMLTGKVPFDDPSAMSVALKHLSEPPPPVRHYNPKIPVTAEKVVMKALEKEPSKRYRSGEAFADALEEALLGSMVDGRPASKPTHPSKAKLATGEYRRLSQSNLRPPTASSPVSLSKAPAKPARRRVSPVLIAGVALIFIAAAVIGALALRNVNSGGAQTPTIVAAAGTEEAEASAIQTITPTLETSDDAPPIAVTEETAESSPTESAPTATATPTRLITVTPTPAPTDTATPTPTETPIPTATDTDIPPTAVSPTVAETPSPTTEPLWVNLIYDADEFLLINQQARAVDLRGLVFVQVIGSVERELDINSVPDTIARIRSIRQNDCIHLWRIELGERLKPDICRARQGYYGLGSPRQFWLNAANPTATFEVRRADVVLATCPVNEGECRLVLQTR